MRSQNWRRVMGSTPEVGSSRKITGGLWRTAQPSARRCFHPPGRVPVIRFSCPPVLAVVLHRFGSGLLAEKFLRQVAALGGVGRHAEQEPVIGFGTNEIDVPFVIRRHRVRSPMDENPELGIFIPLGGVVGAKMPSSGF